MGLSGSLSKYLEEEHDAEVVAVVHRAYTHFWNFAFGMCVTFRYPTSPIDSNK